MKPIVIFTLLSILILGCKKNELVLDVDHSSKYQPLGIGHSWIYQVDSIVFYGNGTQDPDTFTYQIKNQIIDTFTIESDQISYLYNSYYRENDSSSWVASKNYSETRSNTELLRSIDDTKKIAFSFPIVLDKEWDVNQYNTADAQDCYFQSIHQPMQVLETIHDSVTTVYCEYRNNLAERIFSLERYSTNVGMVQREVEDIDGLSPGNPKGPKGSKYTYSLISFEK